MSFGGRRASGLTGAACLVPRGERPARDLKPTVAPSMLGHHHVITTPSARHQRAISAPSPRNHRAITAQSARPIFAVRAASRARLSHGRHLEGGDRLGAAEEPGDDGEDSPQPNLPKKGKKREDEKTAPTPPTPAKTGKMRRQPPHHPRLPEQGR